MTWDEYYYNVCCAVAQNSKCLSRKIGAVLVKDKVIICTGYNGPPRGVPHCEPATIRSMEIPFAEVDTQNLCPRRARGYKSGEGLHLCPAAHAERNCVVQAARLGIQTRGATIYMNCPIPCKDCLIELINAGVEEIVCMPGGLYDHLSGWLLENSDIHVRVFYQFVWEEEDEGSGNQGESPGPNRSASTTCCG